MMLSRSLLARPRLLRVSAVLTTRVCSRSLSTLLHTPAPWCTVSWSPNARRFSAASPILRAEDRHEERPSHTPSGTCYLANIPYKVTAEQLMEAFSEFGKIESIRLLTSDDGLPRGIGFVEFESVADAVNFVQAHEADPFFVLDRQILVAHAQRGRTVSRLAEPSDTLMLLRFQGDSEVEVRAMFGSFADNILAVRFDRKEATQALRKVFIQFHDVNMATEAMDIFRNLNEDSQITYARQRQTPTRSYTLTSRLSQHRGY